MASAPAVLRGGFRPFFLGGAAWAIAALTLWLMALAGSLTLPSGFDPLAWHRHEMLFGFVGAVMAGFMLTAIPNWTGRLPIAGPPLLALFALWLLGRAAVLFSAQVGMAGAAVVDVGFYVVLAAFAAREIVAAKNRNVPMVALFLLFGIANAIDHAVALGFLADEGLGWRWGLALIVLMISLIGGRIIPSFTRNWLTKNGVREGLPGQPSKYDMATLALTGLALFAWIAAPDAAAAGGLLAIAALLQVARLARWSGLRTVRDPFVFILHLGYLWVPVGLALLAASILGAAIPRSAAIHALTAGAMATMILAVMTRASLGHTGRELRADGLTVLAYALVTIGAALRVTAPLGLLDYTLGMHASAICWGAAFAVFLASYGPILVSPRAGES
jgi:uncharacterized protein involved in response to NO